MNTNEEIISKLKGVIPVYKTPIYRLVEVIGKVQARNYQLDKELGLIKLKTDKEFVVIPLMKETLTRGLIYDDDITIGKFICNSSVNYYNNGENLEIRPGDAKVFAFI